MPSALARLTPESMIFYAGKNLIPYEITSYVRVLDSCEIISYEITSYVRVLVNREIISYEIASYVKILDSR